MLTAAERPATLWFDNDLPVRMVYAGRRWRVTDTPTRLRHSVWSAPQGAHRGLYGWRFQGTNDDEQSLVFDVYKGASGWHVHKCYD